MRRSHPKRSGFALVTALFMVMLVYLITTVVMSEANQDAAWTRFGSTRVQAGFLAEQNATLAIQQMNLHNSWSTGHTTDPGTVSSGSAVTWVGNVLLGGTVPSTHQIQLFTRANVGGQVVNQNRIVGQKDAVNPLEFALRDLAATNLPAVIYEHQATGWSTQPLPPIPAVYWTGATAHWARQDPPNASQPGLANKIPAICGDARGNVYCIWNRDTQNELLRYNAGANAWELLPRIIDTSTGLPLPQVTCIACNDKSDLVAICSKGDHDYVAHLDVSQPLLHAVSDYGSTALAGSWTQVATIPSVVYGSGHYTAGSGDHYPGHCQNVAIDNQGHIYAVSQTENSTNPTNVFRYTPTAVVAPNPIDWSLAGWLVLTAPTQITFTWTNNQDVQNPGPTDPPSTKFVENLIAPCVDGQSGDFFGCWNRNNLDPSTPLINTIYHFSPGSSTGVELGGRWQANPLPPPKEYCDLLGNQSPGTGIANPSQYVVDQASNLIGCWEPAGKAATLYDHALVGGSAWTTLDAAPKTSWKLDNTSPDGYSLDPTVGASTDISCLGGGGMPLGSESFVYVPTATY